MKKKASTCGCISDLKIQSEDSPRADEKWIACIKASWQSFLSAWHWQPWWFIFLSKLNSLCSTSPSTKDNLLTKLISLEVLSFESRHTHRAILLFLSIFPPRKNNWVSIFLIAFTTRRVSLPGGTRLRTKKFSTFSFYLPAHVCIFLLTIWAKLSWPAS